MIRKGLFYLCLGIVAYLVLESWAQARFRWQNPTFPFGMRKHMGIHLHDAFALTPNFEGQSGSGVDYKTNELGYSIHPNEDAKLLSHEVMIAGDSRAFSLFLDWEQSLAHQLNQDGLSHHMAAFPGASPSLFHFDLFEKNKIEKLKGSLKKVYYLYDRNDVHTDRLFRMEKSRNYAWYSPRTIKLKLGGFFWNMLKKKTVSFLSKTSMPQKNETTPKISETKKVDGPKGAKSNLRDHEIDEVSLRELQQSLKIHDVELVLVYLPRVTEIVGQNYLLRDKLKAWAENNDASFVDTYDIFHQQLASNPDLDAVFIDAHEGVHFNEVGLALIAKAILENEREKP